MKSYFFKLSSSVSHVNIKTVRVIGIDKLDKNKTFVYLFNSTRL